MKAIYQILNTITGDFYVGSSKDYTYRKWCHVKALKEGKHQNSILQNSWNKHGEDAFLFTILEQIEDNELLIQREQFYINILNPRYNICRIAGSPLGVKHTYEARLHMSLAHQGHNLNGHTANCICTICNRKIGKDHPRYIPRETRYCACGCNNTFICMINSTKKFINGHNNSRKK